MKTSSQVSFKLELPHRYQAPRPAVSGNHPGEARGGASAPAGRRKSGVFGALGLAIALAMLIASTVHGQDTLINGASQAGVISAAGATNNWTVTVNSGETVIVRMGKTDAASSLVPSLRLFGPNGALMDSNYGAVAAEVKTRATASGTFTVVAGDASSGARGTGHYRLTLAKTGSPIVVSDGDEGGPMTNGTTHAGLITTGDLDVWSVTANAGEYLIVRMGDLGGTNSLTPYLRLLSPDGVVLDSNYGAVAAEVQTRATLSGTFTVVAGDASSGSSGTGPYQLTLAKTGSPIVVSDGDEGGPMTNGTTHLGSIAIGDLDVWSITANAGEYLIVRMGDLGGTNSLTPYLRLLGPDGVLRDSNYGAVAAEVQTRATLSGTFTVVVGDASSGSSGIGPYQLTLAKTGSPIVVSAGDEGGPMTNGTTHLGAIVTGDLDVWSVTANAGEYLIVRMGDLGGTNSLTPYLRLLGPEGSLLDSNYGAVAAEVKTRATLSGTFTLVVGDASSGSSGTGLYQLTLAKTGSPIVVSDGDEGGPMKNGTTHLGAIVPGDLDVWSVTAKAGESLLVRMGDLGGTNSLTPYLRLLGPDGVLLDSNYGAVAAEVQTRASLSGSFTVVVGDASSGASGTGPYQLTLAKTGSPIVVSEGDEGGWLTNGVAHPGVIKPGDLDVWAFTACAGAKIQVQIDEVAGGAAFVPWIRLYGRDGALLRSTYGQLTAQISLSAPADGTYTVVVSDASSGYDGTGTYHLSATGIYSGLMLCTPSLSGASLVFSGAGGNPGGQYVVLTTTNITTAASWTPMLTNQFGEFGEFTFANPPNAYLPHQFFRLLVE